MKALAESSMYYLWLRRRRTLKRRPARWREAWAYSWLHQLSFFKLGLLFSINIGEEKLQQVFISHLWKRNVKRILKNVLLSIRGDGKWNDLVRLKRKCRAHLFLMMHILWNLRNFFSAFPFVSKKTTWTKKSVGIWRSTCPPPPQSQIQMPIPPYSLQPER